MEEVHAYRSATRGAQWLFDETLARYLSAELSDQAIYLASACENWNDEAFDKGRDELESRIAKLLIYFAGERRTIDERFNKHMVVVKETSTF